MQRRRSAAPHKFEKNLAAHKAKLEHKISKLKPGPRGDELSKNGYDCPPIWQGIAFLAVTVLVLYSVRGTF
jgi:hypothetical protein